MVRLPGLLGAAAALYLSWGWLGGGLMRIWYQHDWGPWPVGTFWLPVLQVVVAIPAGRLADRLGARRVLLYGAAMLAGLSLLLGLLAAAGAEGDTGLPAAGTGPRPGLLLLGGVTADAAILALNIPLVAALATVHAPPVRAAGLLLLAQGAALLFMGWAGGGFVAALLAGGAAVGLLVYLGTAAAGSGGAASWAPEAEPGGAPARVPVVALAAALTAAAVGSVVLDLWSPGAGAGYFRLAILGQGLGGLVAVVLPVPLLPLLSAAGMAAAASGGVLGAIAAGTRGLAAALIEAGSAMALAAAIGAVLAAAPPRFRGANIGLLYLLLGVTAGLGPIAASLRLSPVWTPALLGLGAFGLAAWLRRRAAGGFEP